MTIITELQSLANKASDESGMLLRDAIEVLLPNPSGLLEPSASLNVASRIAARMGEQHLASQLSMLAEQFQS
jgi:hypothetical protein